VSERVRNMSRGGMGAFGMGGLVAAGMGLEAGTSGEQLARMGADVMDVSGMANMPAGFSAVDEGASSALMMANPLAGAMGALGDVIGAGGAQMAVNVSQRNEIITGAISRAEDRTWSGLGFTGDKDSVQNKRNLDTAKGAMRRLLAADPQLSADFAEYKKKNPEVHKQTQWLMKQLEKKDPEAAAAMREIAGKSGKSSKGGRMMDAMALVMEDAGIKGPWVPDYDKDVARATEMEMFSTSEEYDEAIGKSIEAAASEADSFLQRGGRTTMGVPTGLIGMGISALMGDYGPSEETLSAFEDLMQADHGDLVARSLAGDPDAVEELARNPSAIEARDKIVAIIGDDPERQQAVGEKLKKATRQRHGKAAREMRSKTAEIAKRALQANVGAELGTAQRETMSQLLKVYAGEDYIKGTKKARDEAERLATDLMESGDLSTLREKGGVVGRQLAQFGMAGRKLGQVSTGQVTMEQLQREMKGVGGIPEGMRAELQAMVESGGEFTTEERSKFQAMFKERAAGAGIMGGMTGRKAGTDRLTEVLTAYTEANTKFVFAVGASIQGIDVEDLQKRAAETQAAMREETGRRT